MQRRCFVFHIKPETDRKNLDTTKARRLQATRSRGGVQNCSSSRPSGNCSEEGF